MHYFCDQMLRKIEGVGYKLLLLRNAKKYSAIALLLNFLMSASKQYSNKES